MAGVSGPGVYPVVVIGSGPGAIQTSYSLTQEGVAHAVISEDDQPGGMFRRFPLFQRLITWTKPFAPAGRGTREYERYDWNSLLSEDPSHQALVAGFMDGASYFPSRPEMESGLVAFTDAAGLPMRYGCRWESTSRDGEHIVIGTTQGEYRARALVVAVGMTQPWKPPIEGLDLVPHYTDTAPAKDHAGKRVLIVGKRNSGFEIADALLPWARQIVLASPRPARISVIARSTAAARARYLQPYEDHVLGGGNMLLDATIDRVEPLAGGGYRVHTSGTTRPGRLALEVDVVIAATGFTTPLGDLPALGVKTFMQGRLPVQTPFWESPGAPGIFFAGSITQGSIGLKKYGIPSNSAAVHGFRYNARVLAGHLAGLLGASRPRPQVAPADVTGFLASEATNAPELWNQQSYLARVVTFGDRIEDTGIVPLQHFVDSSGPDAAAITLETDDTGDIHPALYLRRSGSVEEHLLPSDPMHAFDGSQHRAMIADRLKPWLG